MPCDVLTSFLATVALVALAFDRLRTASSIGPTAVQACLHSLIAEQKFEVRVKEDPFWHVGEAIYID